MSLSSPLLHQIADQLEEAEKNLSPIDSLVAAHPEFDGEDAYHVQLHNANRAVKEGRRLVGYKIGLTSREAQRYFKVFEPDFGHLFDDMALPEDEEIDLSRLIQPKIEGEIALVLGRDIKGPGLTMADILDAVDYAMAAFEIIDSRIRDWKISAADTIADNGSSACFVLGGTRRRVDQLDLPSLGMAIWKNAEVWATGSAAAVMGNPLSAVLFLANELGKHDRGLLAGEVILSGAISSMITMAPKDVYRCEVLGLGRIDVRVGEGRRK